MHGSPLALGQLLGLISLVSAAFIGCLGGSDPATVYSVQRSPITFNKAISLVREGNIRLVDINVVAPNAHFELQASPSQQWPGSGYLVTLFDGVHPAGLAVMTPGKIAVGIEDLALAQLLEEVNSMNQGDPCRILVFDHRAASSPSPTTPGCDLS